VLCSQIFLGVHFLCRVTWFQFWNQSDYVSILKGRTPIFALCSNLLIFFGNKQEILHFLLIICLHPLAFHKGYHSTLAALTLIILFVEI
jgi:hypothetical protein